MVGHYFCDLQKLVETCLYRHLHNQSSLGVQQWGICTESFVMLMVSYVIILHSLRNHSAEGRYLEFLGGSVG